MSPVLHKTINLLPTTPASIATRTSRKVLPLASSIVGALAIIALDLASAPTPTAQASARPEVTTMAPSAQLATDDPGALALRRAGSWLPLDDLMARLPELLPPDARLEQLQYREEAGQLTLTGTVAEVRHLAELMLALTDFPWLVDTEPHQVERLLDAERTRFSVRSRVVPFIRVVEMTP